MDLKTIFFPHDKIRPVQEEFIKEVQTALSQKKSIIIHAPTGLGKTAAALCPSLAYARQNKLTVIFLTSRHTQHKIVIDTLKAIKQKYNTNIISTSVIGKKNMCIQPNIELMRSTDFTEYCKYLREDNKCEYYINARTKPTVESEITLSEMAKNAPITCEETIQQSKNSRLCPYEMSLLLAEKSEVIITDYYYIFNPAIRTNFLSKIHKELQNTIIIIDEGHNLPSRLRELLTKKISNITIKKAIKESKEQYKNQLIEKLVQLQDAINKISKNLKNNEEIKIEKEQLIQEVKRITDYDQFIEELEEGADETHKQQKQSYLSSIAQFLKSWPEHEKGYSRIMKREDPFITISHKCLDPSLASKEIIDTAHTTILMSGTLTPTHMYKELLGFPTDNTQKEYPSPFPQQNKLAIIVPKTTTKYTERNETQYREIAKILAEITNNVPGSTAIFFPSYNLRDQINNFFQEQCEKTLLLEQPGLTKEAKQQLLDKLKSYGKNGAVLLGTAAGSFGEGIDLPGVLKAVIIVGLPLDKPTLETQELIKYYDERYGKGWDYGYTLPALTKCLQNAGRCIRTEQDKGVIIFLDSRYTQHTYIKCFPPDWQLKISLDYLKLINEFFNKKQEETPVK